MTTPQNNGGPITPSMVMRQQVAPDTFAESRMDAEGGLTLRDWFAGMALPQLLAMPTPPAWRAHSEEWRLQCGAEAYLCADAMLAARKEDA
jgi:hypothetical protein